MGKWDTGTHVVPTREAIKWYREHLFDTNNVRGSVEASEVILWATADLDLPIGKVIAGTPTCPDTTVKVRFTNKFGTYEHYLDKDSLLRKGKSYGTNT